jgi:L-ribulose-5-phosphate 3-epimerase
MSLSNKVSVGIMQGRLSKPEDGRIQSFPWNTWEHEFFLARDIGFDEIEFIFEAKGFDRNPLFTSDGLIQIRKLIEGTGVRVNTVCADYFMDRPFVGVNKANMDNNLAIFNDLVEHCSVLNVSAIEIPFLDNSMINSDEEFEDAVKCIRACIKISENYHIRIGLETSLRSEIFRELLERINHELLYVVYDIGNSASLAFNPVVEFDALGDYIQNVHVKDRLVGSATVPLGEGDADFDKVFNALRAKNYSGSFIIQAARNGDDIVTATHYKHFVDSYIKRFLV